MPERTHSNGAGDSAPAMTGTAATAVADAIEALGKRAVMLEAVPVDRLARALAAAAQALQDRYRDEPPADLLVQSGLSEPMLRWALQTSLAAMTAPALQKLGARHRVRPPRGPCAVVLSGNVVTAPLRAMALPLLARRPVIAKSAFGHDALPRAFQAALGEADRELGQCLAVCGFARTDRAAARALLRGCPIVSAYGDDHSLREIGDSMPPGRHPLAHGHGLGAVFLDREALTQGRPELMARVALDVAAYDQRGCLSPQHVFVERGAASLETLAQELFAGLSDLQLRLPRGPLPAEAAAAVAQWRGVAAACGTLLECDTHGVSVETRARVGPGHRHVAVIGVADAHGMAEHLSPFGRHLKTVATTPAGRHRLAEALAAQGQRVQLAEVGAIQTPPLDALSDGLHPMAGL